MPKVSDGYRDSRRQQILDAARHCFARDGFHQTSMQDLFAEAGLSSGAVYRYFPSKDAMILAIAEQNMRSVVDTVVAVTAQHQDRPLGDVLADILDLIATRHRADGVGDIALTVWSEAVRNPSLAQQLHASLDGVRTQMTELARQHQRAGRLPDSVSPEAVTATLLSLVPGYIMQLTLHGPDAVAGIADTVRALWPDGRRASAQ